MSVSAFPYGGVIGFARGVALSGSSGTPNVSQDTQDSPTDATATWSFASDGDLTRSAAYAPDPHEWFFPEGSAPDKTYYIRATLDAGSAPDSGPALNTAHALTTTRAWSWIVTGLGVSSGTLKIEIATDSGMTDIVATGYYQGIATVNAA